MDRNKNRVLTAVRHGLVGLPLLLLPAAGLHAQMSTPAATGTVVSPSGTPAANVPLQVQGPEGKTVVFTDSQGQWSLYNLPAGKYQVAPVSKSPNTEQAVQFTIQDKGVFSKFVGSATTQSTSEIKLK